MWLFAFFYDNVIAIRCIHKLNSVLSETINSTKDPCPKVMINNSCKKKQKP